MTMLLPFSFSLSLVEKKQRKKVKVQKVSPCDSLSSTWVLGMSNLVFWDYFQQKRFYNRETISLYKDSPYSLKVPPLFHDWLRYLN